MTAVYFDTIYELEIFGITDFSVPTDAIVEQILTALPNARNILQPSGENSPTPATSRARFDIHAGPGGLSGQLDRITTWTQTHLGRAAFLPAADPSDIAAAQQYSGNRWPQDLLDLFSRINGSELPILPEHDLLSLDRSNDIRQLWLDITTDLRQRHPEMAADFDPEVLGAMPAGTPAGIYLPQFVPIADRDGATLVVDTRPGDLHGCITEYTAEGSDDDGPLWTSLAAMLTNLADSLETGTEFLRDRPSAVAGELIWEQAR
ncbi:SMI1/KNR4 family protein [Nocardia altamirensis]|uniref:SMI1/KNR4 family protein n=1 Tax=Nocardia altamirensis TaxID=472158 RepID=UPI00114CA851|nr:SMI1/KNR4 family protein [Nocardia altamirensis]